MLRPVMFWDWGVWDFGRVDFCFVFTTFCEFFQILQWFELFEGICVEVCEFLNLVTDMVSVQTQIDEVENARFCHIRF